MTSKNDITGDSLVSKTSEAYRSNYDLIFRKRDTMTSPQQGDSDEKTSSSSSNGDSDDSSSS